MWVVDKAGDIHKNKYGTGGSSQLNLKKKGKDICVTPYNSKARLMSQS